MPTAYIGVGSNVAPEENVPKALDLLKGIARVTASSRFYATEPIGRPDQAPYANGVVRIETDIEPFEIKERLRAIESILGRKRTPDRFAPRTIDLDLLLYGSRVIAEAGLVVPSPEILSRRFVGYPLLEIEPGLVLPGTGRPLRELLPPDGGPSRVNDSLTREVTRRIET